MSNHPQKLVRTVLIFSFPVLRNRSREFDVCRKRDCKSLYYAQSYDLEFSIIRSK